MITKALTESRKNLLEFHVESIRINLDTEKFLEFALFLPLCDATVHRAARAIHRRRRWHCR